MLSSPRQEATELSVDVQLDILGIHLLDVRLILVLRIPVEQTLIVNPKGTELFVDAEKDMREIRS